MMSPYWSNWYWDVWTHTRYIGRSRKCLLLENARRRSNIGGLRNVTNMDQIRARWHENTVGQWRSMREGWRCKSNNINKEMRMTLISHYHYHYWVRKLEHRERGITTMETSGDFEVIGMPYCVVTVMVVMILWDQKYLIHCQSWYTLGRFMGNSQRSFQRNSFNLSRFHTTGSSSFYSTSFILWQEQLHLPSTGEAVTM